MRTVRVSQPLSGMRWTGTDGVDDGGDDGVNDALKCMGSGDIDGGAVGGYNMLGFGGCDPIVWDGAYDPGACGGGKGRGAC